MKTKMIPLLAVLVFTSSFSFNAAAADPSKSSVLNMVVEKVMKLGKKAASDLLCRKASIFTKTFSFRSFEGRLCAIPAVAKMAVALCTDADIRSKEQIADFEASHCAKVAGVAKDQPVSEEDENEVNKVENE